MKSRCWRLALLLAALLAGSLAGQQDEYELAPIHYSATEAQDVVSRLMQQLGAGEKSLDHDPQFGFLPALLQELHVPVSSQVLVFSKTSLQRTKIAPRTPRAIYFSDDIYVGYCHQGEVLEISVADPQLGAVFYTLDQHPVAGATVERQGESCLICHGGSQTRGVPGHLVRSLYTDTRGFPILSAGSYKIDHTSPFEHRWGGWYVTGTHGGQTHRGNLIVKDKTAPEEADHQAGQNRRDLSELIDPSQYLTPHSDLVALMVLEHQTEGHNLLTKASFETRSALHREAALKKALSETDDRRWDSTVSRIRSVGEPLVRYLLFSGEAKLTAPVQGTSGFAEEFSARGPHDAQGRSLRQFDLERRMFKYPCSYLIYSPSFTQLPEPVKSYVYQRLWEVLSGKDASKEFAHLSAADRRNIREILVATLPDVPAQFR